MELRTALYISGAAHGALAVWALVAGFLSSDLTDPFEATNVTVISGADFAALVDEAGGGAASPGAIEPEATAQPEPEPEPEPETAAVAPEPDEVTPVEPAAEPAAEPDPVPDPVPDLVPDPEPAADPAPDPAPEPDIAEAPEPEPSPVPETDATELASQPGDVPDPAPRVASRPAERPDPTIAEAPDEVAATEPTEAEETPVEAETEAPAAPEEATTRIATEATEVGGAEQIALAPATALRPRARPARPTPTETATAPEPAPEPATEPEQPADPAPTQASADPLAAAMAAAAEAAAEAAAGGGTDSANFGPPLTAGERDALRLAVQECWVVDVGSEAANVTVTVGMSMTPNGTVSGNEVRMLSATGGSDAAVRAAYNAARRAILRCQEDGYSLPEEKYAQWQEIEMVFNPSEMRLR